jgi:hypothetical protein
MQSSPALTSSNDLWEWLWKNIRVNLRPFAVKRHMLGLVEISED